MIELLPDPITSNMNQFNNVIPLKYYLQPTLYQIIPSFIFSAKILYTILISPHTPPTLCFLILLSLQLVKSTNNEIPHYAQFVSFLFLPLIHSILKFSLAQKRYWYSNMASITRSCDSGVPTSQCKFFIIRSTASIINTDKYGSLTNYNEYWITLN
jgi:hypothetical protein